MDNTVSYKSQHQIYLYISYFLLLYGITIFNINFKYVYMVVGLSVIFARLNLRLPFPKYAVNVMAYLFFLIVWSAFNTTINKTGDYFESFRFARCLASTVIIILLIEAFDIEFDTMIHLLKNLCLLNAIAILLCMIYPKLNEILLPISQYQKTFSALRTPGLTNGEDASGFLLVVGYIIEMIELERKDKNPLSLTAVIFLVASIFTSRYTLFLMTIVTTFNFIRLKRAGKGRKANSLLVVLIPIAVVAFLYIVLTTGFAMNIRNKLLGQSARMRNLYTKLTGSFLDYGIFSSAVTRNITANLTDEQWIFGVGYKINVSQDSGYVKTLYSLGIFGIIAELLFHINLLWIIRKNNVYSKIEVADALIAFVVLVIVLWELKYSFMFSSTIYEMLISLFFSFMYTKTKNEQLAIV